jgi:hypothetical protein
MPGPGDVTTLPTALILADARRSVNRAAFFGYYFKLSKGKLWQVHILNI